MASGSLPGFLTLRRMASVLILAGKLCAAESISIDGVVLDAVGQGISGATVRLEHAQLVTTTGPDGAFILAGAAAPGSALRSVETGAAHPSWNRDPAPAWADLLTVAAAGHLDHRDLITTDTGGRIVVRLLANAGDVVDADGNVYQSVRIGNQVWTVGDLRTTTFNDGTAIPEITDTSAWGEATTPGRCWYHNDASLGPISGCLYNWFAVNTGRLAPAGWRVATDADWSALDDHLRADADTAAGHGYAKAMAARMSWRRCTAQGAVGNDLSRNNASGFSALPGGFRSSAKDRGVFATRGEFGFWWSATASHERQAYSRCLFYGDAHLLRHVHNVKFGLSVRLVRD